MDPVKGFRSLDDMDDDEVKMDLMEALPGQRDSFGVERSIGGADLSGILAVDDEDVDEDANLVQGYTLYSKLDEKIRAQGDQQGMMQATDSDSWDSDDCRAGNAAGVKDRAVSGDSVKVGGFGEVDKTCECEKPLTLLVADDAAVLTRGSAIGSWNENSPRNPNMSSPTRPAEEGSDWDGAGDNSSDDLELLNFQKPPHSYQNLAQTNTEQSPTRGKARQGGGRRHSRTSSQSPAFSTSETRSPKSDIEEASAASGSSGRGRRHPRLQATSSAKPNSTLRTVDAGSIDGATVSDGERKRRAFPSQLSIDRSPSKLTKPLVQDKGESTANLSRRGRQIGTSGSGAESQDASSAGTKTAAAESEAAAAAIESLQAELCRLREHVLRSEQRREEQLREFENRLKEQERRISARVREGTLVPQRMLDSEAALVADVDEGGEARRARRDRYDDTETPHRAAGHNPFAPTVGGAETPRVHFPAFEEALQDGREDAEPKGTEDDADGAMVDKSALQDEAFEFSIDTLSHINNHTNFGTDLPGPSITATKTAISTEVSRGRSLGATLRSTAARRTPVKTSDSKVRDPSRVAEETEEAFDDIDTAAEEAFFADAHATASLQTPVKHVVGTAASAVGVAVRKARLDCRSSRGSSAERPFVEGAQARESQPVHSSKSEQSDHNAIDGSLVQLPRAPGCESASPSNSCERESVGIEQEELCMADFFAHASAVLDSRTECGSGERARTSVCGGTGTGTSKVASSNTVLRSPSCDEVRSPGVSVATQTTWSFAAHEQVRFVSSSDRTLMADGKDSLQGSGVESWDTGIRSTDPSDSTHLAELRARQSLRGNAHASGRKGTRSVQLHTDSVQRASSIPRCPFPPQLKARERNSRENGDNPLSEGRSVVSGGCGLFDSPKLSPSADASRRTYRATSDVAGFSHTSVQNAMSGENRCNEKEDSRALPCDGARTTRRQLQRGCDHFLSPILSQGNPSLSLSGDARSVFDPLLGTEAWKSVGSSSDTTGIRSTKQDADGSGEERAEPSGRQKSSSVKLQILKAAAEVAKGDASVDVTRSSLLRVSTRASTTLETIAPLEDDSNDRSFLFHSRVGDSCPEELFADGRLPPCVASAPPRQSRSQHPRLGHLQPHDGPTLPPPMTQERLEQSRSRPAPTLPSEFSENLRERPLPRPQGATGVPPAVVGAWLAAAIEGLYGYGQHGRGDVSGTGCVVDQRAKSTKSGRHHDPRAFGAAFCQDAVLSRSPQRNLRERRTNESSQPKQSLSIGIPVYDEDSGDLHSPPPPPPLLPLNVQNGLDDFHHDNGDDMAEEDIFYQRQQLLRRVVCAAASHGGVMPISAQGNAATAAANVSEGALPMKIGQDARSVVMECSPRRHSDPLSWKTNSGTTAVSTGAGNSSTGAGVRAARGTGSYMWRRTSGYWRDRLGMTQ